MTKKQLPRVISKALEDKIDINYTIVGTNKWVNDNISEPGKRKITSVHKESDLNNIFHYLYKQPIHGLDTETTGESKYDGLDPLSPKSRLLLFQYGTQEQVLIIEPDLVKHFKHILEDSKYIKLGQNLVYDFKFFLAKYDIHLVNLYDTMIAEQILTAGVAGSKVGLDDITRKYPPYLLIDKAVRKEFFNFVGKLQTRHLYYAAKDVYTLFPVYKAQKELLKKYDMEVGTQDEFNCIYVTAEMELSGVTFDADILRLAIQPYKDRAIEIKSRVMQIFNTGLENTHKKSISLFPEMPEEFDINSPSQKLEALNLLGIDIIDTKRETLKLYDLEITALLAEYTECTKIISTYGDSLLEKRNKTTGLFHPKFNQLGAGDLDTKRGRATTTTIATGRYSSDFQQIPRPKNRIDPVTNKEELKLVEETFKVQIAEAKEKK